MTFSKKEFLWFLGAVLTSFLTLVLIFGIDGFKADETIDINIHDTYFVFSNTPFFWFLGALIFFVIYFFRMIRGKFKNVFVGILVLLFCLGLILLLSKIIYVVDSLLQSTIGFQESGGDKEISPVTKILSAFTNVLFVIKVLFLLILSYSAYRIGKTRG